MPAQTALTSEQRQALALLAQRELRRRARDIYRSEPPGRGGMSVQQRELYDDPSPKRYAVKANKVGLTYHAAQEAWMFLESDHPNHNLPRDNRGLWVVPDLDKSYADDVCRVLRECQPPGVLADGCRYDETRGYLVKGTRGLLTRHGSRIIFRSANQEITSTAGAYADWGIINEPPPPHLWGEIMRWFSMREDTPVLVAFTAVDDLRKDVAAVGWLRDIFEADGSTWSGHAFPLCDDPENPDNKLVPHRSVESIKRQIDDCPPWERDQRILARWTAAAIDRVFVSYSDKPYPAGNVLPESMVREVVPQVVGVGIGLDHGELPGNEAGPIYVFWERDNLPHVLILDEYVSTGRTTVQTDVIAIDRILEARNLSYYSVDEAFGDTNSAGKTRMISVNQEFEAEIARFLSLNACPFRFLPARKGTGSIGWGARVLDGAFSTGRLLVHERCSQHREAFSQWRGKDDQYKHRIDGARYALAKRLDTSRPKAQRIGVG